MIRNLVTKISQIFAERSHAARIKCSVPIKITFEQAKNTAKLTQPSSPLFITGETCDLSGSGIAFIVSSIRVKENYLVGQDRVLIAELDLPDGKIQMKVVGKRYEQVGVHVSTEKYLIGAEIVDISEADREAYDYFLKFGRKRKKAAASMELGID